MNAFTTASTAAVIDATPQPPTRQALDAFGYAGIAVRASSGRLVWQTPLARELMSLYFGTVAPHMPASLLAWLRRTLAELPADGATPASTPEFRAELGARKLCVRLHHGIESDAGDDDWLLVMREVSDVNVIRSLGLAFSLTAREAEVLYWVARGRIDRDIADLLGTGPAMVEMHLERIHAKLGVETRTAAAEAAVNRVRQAHPQWEV